MTKEVRLDLFSPALAVGLVATAFGPDELAFAVGAAGTILALLAVVLLVGFSGKKRLTEEVPFGPYEARSPYYSVTFGADPIVMPDEQTEHQPDTRRAHP